jgi:hypothetical protein
VRFHIERAKASTAREGFIPNPKLKLLEQVSEVFVFRVGPVFGVVFGVGP